VERVPAPVVIALLLNHHRVFMTQRNAPKPLAGEWEFPGGNVEMEEPPVDALRRELIEELELPVRRLILFGAYSHLYEFPEGPVHYVLLAYRANVRDGAWARAGRWMGAEALEAASVVAGSVPIVSDLLTAHLVR